MMIMHCSTAALQNCSIALLPLSSCRCSKKGTPTSALVQCCLQGSDEIRAIFNATGHTNEAVGDANLQPVLLEHVSVCHHSTGRDDALRGTEILTKAPRSRDAVHELRAGCRAANNVKPKHSAVQSITVVLVSNVFLREGSQARVHHLGDLGVCLQVGSKRHCILALLPDAQGHGLRSLQHHECGEWVHDVAVHILHPLDLSRHLLVGTDDSTSCHHVVPFIVLGQTLDDHVCTMIKRPADDWCCKRGINHVFGSMLMGNV